MSKDIEWGKIALTGPEIKKLNVPGNVPCSYEGFTATVNGWNLDDDSRSFSLPANDPSYLCHVHNEANRTSFKPWYGGYQAPGDWTSGTVLFRTGQTGSVANNWVQDGKFYDIIGYHALPKQEEVAGEVPEWALEQALAVANKSRYGNAAPWHAKEIRKGKDSLSYCAVTHELARYIAEHEEAPVDPDLLVARDMVADDSYALGYPEDAQKYKEGKLDSHKKVKLVLAALKRGRELAAQA